MFFERVRKLLQIQEAVLRDGRECKLNIRFI